MNSVVSMSMEASRGNLYLLTIIFWFEILFFLIIYDFVIIETHGFISYYLHELGQFTVRMKKVGITLYIIRLNYYLLRLTRILRLGWVTYGSGEKSSVWLGISKFSLSQILLIIFKNIISVPMILAFLFASFLLKAVRGDISYYLSKLQEPLKGILQIKIDIGDVFLRLPALVSLMTILPIVFFFYFHSQKREVRKIIDNENSQYFEEVVLLYEKLLIWIDQHIYQISKNFDYVINCQDSIVELFLEKAIPNYMSLTRKQYYIPVSIEHFRFIEIADLNELQEIIAKLSSDRLIRFTRTFSVKRFDIWYLYFWEFRSFSKIEQIEEFFYTQKGMITKLAMCNKYLYDFTQVQLEKERKDEQLRLSCSIYNDLKLLYKGTSKNPSFSSNLITQTLINQHLDFQKFSF